MRSHKTVVVHTQELLLRGHDAETAVPECAKAALALLVPALNQALCPRQHEVVAQRAPEMRDLPRAALEVDVGGLLRQLHHGNPDLAGALQREAPRGHGVGREEDAPVAARGRATQALKPQLRRAQQGLPHHLRAHVVVALEHPVPEAQVHAHEAGGRRRAAGSRIAAGNQGLRAVEQLRVGLVEGEQKVQGTAQQVLPVDGLLHLILDASYDLRQVRHRAEVLHEGGRVRVRPHPEARVTAAEDFVQLVPPAGLPQLPPHRSHEVDLRAVLQRAGRSPIDARLAQQLRKVRAVPHPL
mmetsp:Transcript_14336/g.38104  ORF Transcript_14336/g.38104 Transcript_14336/m.38104 type:complete len:298 (-) Transcript_14336:101-994(-)